MVVFAPLALALLHPGAGLLAQSTEGTIDVLTGGVGIVPVSANKAAPQVVLLWKATSNADWKSG